MEIITKQLVVGEVEFNFEEVKTQLSEYSEKYKDLVVTEENLKEMNAVKIELGKVENSIEEYRKKQKKEMETPIKAFEKKCKELLEVVESVSLPIKSQLEFYEEERKKEKTEEIISNIKDICEEFFLNEKYSCMLNIIPKYLNKTQKEKDTIDDLKNRATQLKLLQDQEKSLEELKKQKLDLIQVTIEQANKEFNTNLKISDFSRLQEAELSDITKTINARANYIHQERLAEENKKSKLEPKEEVVIEKEIKLFDFSLKINKCSSQKARLLKDFLEKNNYKYELKGV